jgi:hypothetical protein
MQNTSFYCRLAAVVGASALLSIGPGSLRAQSGKWVATISQLTTTGGAADLSVEPRNDKQSRARITLRNTKRDTRLAWDIVEGSCRDEGKPIAPQATFGGIQTQMDGTGSVTSNVPKLESGKRYYVRVFDPQTAVTDETALGCANISEKP